MRNRYLAKRYLRERHSPSQRTDVRQCDYLSDEEAGAQQSNGIIILAVKDPQCLGDFG